MSYYEKYLKYKSKYISLKNSLKNYHGGVIDENNNIEELDQTDLFDNVYLIHAFPHEDTDFLNRFVIEGEGDDQIIRYSCEGKWCEKYIHTSWGVLVLPHLNGQWDYMDNAIIVPLKKQNGRIFKINPNDTMIFTKLNIERGNSFFVYNTEQYEKVGNNAAALKRLEEAGFELIPFTKNPLSDEQVDEIIKQIDEMPKDGDLEINGKNYGKINAENYNENVLDCDVELNDRNCLKHILGELKSNKSWNNPIENSVNQYKSFMSCEDISGIEFFISMKQMNILYPMANDIIFQGQTLRGTIDAIPKIRDSFQNKHCKINGITEYRHPTPCFTYKDKSYRLGDENLMSDELKQKELDEKLLVGRHRGFDKTIKPTNFIDSIQYYTSFPDQKEKAVKEEIDDWNIQKDQVFSRSNKQFEFNNDVKEEIEEKMKKIGFYK